MNDHFFKAEFSNTITGKASDVAGLILFPLVVISLLDIATWSVARTTLDLRYVLVPVLVITGLGFAAVQLSDVATAAYDGFSALIWRPASSTQDPSDLFALPALALAAIAAIHSSHCAEREQSDSSSNS